MHVLLLIYRGTSLRIEMFVCFMRTVILRFFLLFDVLLLVLYFLSFFVLPHRPNDPTFILKQNKMTTSSNEFKCRHFTKQIQFILSIIPKVTNQNNVK